MRRIWFAAAIAAAASTFATSPALASDDGQSCHGTFISTVVEGVGAKEAAAGFGWTVQEAQGVVRFVCGQADRRAFGTPPKCENGQATAADQALARGDLGKWLFHEGALENCYLGDPAGPPLGAPGP